MSGFEYTIPAIPTEYNGRQYRSRLEARWAAFFDLIGWKAEYEPFELGKWSPDFLLVGGEGRRIPVEVKPLTEFHRDTGRRIADAASAAGFGQALLVGSGPTHEDCDYSTTLGWIADLGWESLDHRWHWAEFVRQIDEPRSPPDIAGNYRLSGCLYGTDFRIQPAYELALGLWEDRIQRAWSEAANKVQWHPKRRRR